ncbi:MAG: hypothetical protein GQ557_01315, partial [Mycoplasmataceae bacterium]|nr:hypothetical protein [Mycoplasmataceae bacterium]
MNGLKYYNPQSLKGDRNNVNDNVFYNEGDNSVIIEIEKNEVFIINQTVSSLETGNLDIKTGDIIIGDFSIENQTSSLGFHHNSNEIIRYNSNEITMFKNILPSGIVNIGSNTSRFDNGYFNNIGITSSFNTPIVETLILDSGQSSPLIIKYNNIDRININSEGCIFDGSISNNSSITSSSTIQGLNIIGTNSVSCDILNYNTCNNDVTHNGLFDANILKSSLLRFGQDNESCFQYDSPNDILRYYSDYNGGTPNNELFSITVDEINLFNPSFNTSNLNINGSISI